MNGYLLLLVGPADDLPVRLFATRAGAAEFARRVPPGPLAGENAKSTAHELRRAANVVGRGPGEPFGYAVAEFFCGEVVGYEAWWDDNGDRIPAAVA